MPNTNLIYSGKVRNIFQHEDHDKLYIETTNRLSSFDKYICDLKDKGQVLTHICAHIFNRTKHIIPNHYISHNNNILIVKKCEPFKIEFVVRGYITGNTNTSLWTHYNRGIRNYCGINFPDNLKKKSEISTPSYYTDHKRHRRHTNIKKRDSRKQLHDARGLRFHI